MIIDERIEISKSEIKDMKLRELLDNIKNLQLLWKTVITENEPRWVRQLTESLFRRFGFFALRAYEDTELNSLDDVEVLQSASNMQRALLRLNNACVRRTIAFFYCAFRHLQALDAQHALPCQELQCEVHSHLLSASLDDFFSLSMYFDTPVSATLEYRHEFTGMFNSISQVMYYNNPEYERRQQKRFDELVKCDDPIHILPLFMQLYPTLPIVREDDAYPDDFKPPVFHDDALERVRRAKHSEFMWLILPGRIYLVHKDGTTLHCDNAAALFNVVARNTTDDTTDTATASSSSAAPA